MRECLEAYKDIKNRHEASQAVLLDERFTADQHEQCRQALPKTKQMELDTLGAFNRAKWTLDNFGRY